MMILASLRRPLTLPLKQILVMAVLAAASPSLAVDVIYDEMRYSPFNYGSFDTRLFSSASDFLSEEYFVLNPGGPDTIQGDQSTIDTDEAAWRKRGRT